jgi:hemoglobin
MTTLYEHAGGEEALHRLEDIFYGKVLSDPLLQPLFGAGQPEHVEHLTWFTAESFGGPDRFSRELGFQHLIDVHRGLRISEAQRARFVELYMAALDEAEMPGDEPFRRAVRGHLEFGSRVAMQNSNATTDRELHPLREVPRWTWAGDRRRATLRPTRGDAAPAASAPGPVRSGGVNPGGKGRSRAVAHTRKADVSNTV